MVILWETSEQEIDGDKWHLIYIMFDVWKGSMLTRDTWKVRMMVGGWRQRGVDSTLGVGTF